MKVAALRNHISPAIVGQIVERGDFFIINGRIIGTIHKKGNAEIRRGKDENISAFHQGDRVGVIFRIHRLAGFIVKLQVAAAVQLGLGVLAQLDRGGFPLLQRCFQAVFAKVFLGNQFDAKIRKGKGGAVYHRDVYGLRFCAAARQQGKADQRGRQQAQNRRFAFHRSFHTPFGAFSAVAAPVFPPRPPQGHRASWIMRGQGQKAFSWRLFGAKGHAIF